MTVSIAFNRQEAKDAKIFRLSWRSWRLGGEITFLDPYTSTTT